MTLTSTQLFDSKRKECRRYERVELSLSGRYMLRNHHEYPCWTINISSGGIAIVGVEKGLIGESIVAYFSTILAGSRGRSRETSINALPSRCSYVLQNARS